jgi:hypothetical protein
MEGVAQLSDVEATAVWSGSSNIRQKKVLADREQARREDRAMARRDSKNLQALDKNILGERDWRKLLCLASELKFLWRSRMVSFARGRTILE